MDEATLRRALRPLALAFCPTLAFFSAFLPLPLPTLTPTPAHLKRSNLRLQPRQSIYLANSQATHQSSLSRPSLADPSTETVNTPPPLPPPPAINLNPPSNSTPITTPHPLLPTTVMANDSAANTPAAESTGSAPMRPGGAPARVYMNERIVPYLLEGMKVVAKEQYVLSFLPVLCIYHVYFLCALSPRTSIPDTQCHAHEAKEKHAKQELELTTPSQQNQAVEPAARARRIPHPEKC